MNFNQVLTLEATAYMYMLAELVKVPGIKVDADKFLAKIPRVLAVYKANLPEGFTLEQMFIEGEKQMERILTQLERNIQQGNT